MKSRNWWQGATQWLQGSPDRSLEQAFRAALSIRDIEDQYFQGKKVGPENCDYGASVITYFTNEVQRHLRKIEQQLYHLNSNETFARILTLDSSQEHDQKTTYTLEKLHFIDDTLARYEGELPQVSPPKQSLGINILDPQQIAQSKQRRSRQIQRDTFKYIRKEESQQKLESATQKSGVLPRSFLRTVNRLKQEMDPQSDSTEQKVLKQYRNSRYKTALSVKFLLTLIIIPLLAHQLTKTFFLLPSVEGYFERNAEVIFINQNMEQEAYEELNRFEESLRFRSLLGFSEKLTPEEIEEQLAAKAVEISHEYRRVSTNAIANIFADIFSLVSFVIVLVTSQREIEVLKEFIDEIVYGLSDSAKAFLIILFTDMFVGFHSPHGWEVILASIARHFGLPENEDFNFLFIATFPVILDTVFKYWIFRYLNGISPSSVATYRNMNE
ncbi:MAG: proton extrusion protein PcxA [Synechocystis sp.]|nr:proton extrusion protein PcxA [Synechocystis sp.]